MHQFARRCALGAMRAAVDRRIPSRLLADPHAVLRLRPITVQPTEQCVQMFLRMVTCAPAVPAADRASALRTLPSGSAPTAARPPAAKAGTAQERAAVETALRTDLEEHAASVAAASLTICSLDQHGLPPSLRRIAVDAVEGLHLRRVRLVAGLALFIVRLGVGARRRRRAARRPPLRRRLPRRACAETHDARLQACDALVMGASSVLFSVALWRAGQAGSAKASVSISTNTRPSVPTRR